MAVCDPENPLLFLVLREETWLLLVRREETWLFLVRREDNRTDAGRIAGAKEDQDFLSGGVSSIIRDS